MILEQLSDSVYYLPHNSQLDRPTLGYIHGDKFSVMVDCGTSPSHLAIFEQGLLERNLPYPKLAIITHWHWDHTFGMSAFKGLTVANTITNNRLKQMQQWSWTDQEMQNRLDSDEEIEFCDHHIRLEYPDTSKIQITSADILFKEELRIDLGNVHCNISLIGGKHAEDSNIIHIPEEKIYFIGDSDSEDFYHNNGRYHKDQLESLIEFWEQKEFTWYVHGHLTPASKEQVIARFNKELSLIK